MAALPYKASDTLIIFKHPPLHCRCRADRWDHFHLRWRDSGGLAAAAGSVRLSAPTPAFDRRQAARNRARPAGSPREDAALTPPTSTLAAGGQPGCRRRRTPGGRLGLGSSNGAGCGDVSHQKEMSPAWRPSEFRAASRCPVVQLIPGLTIALRPLGSRRSKY
jgi:hypothetical protein